MPQLTRCNAMIENEGAIASGDPRSLPVKPDPSSPGTGDPPVREPINPDPTTPQDVPVREPRNPTPALPEDAPVREPINPDPTSPDPDR